MENLAVLSRSLAEHGHLQMPDQAFKVYMYLLLSADPKTRECLTTYRMIREGCCAPDRPPWAQTTINLALDYLELNGCIRRLKGKKGTPLRVKVINDGTKPLGELVRLPSEDKNRRRKIPSEVRAMVLIRDKRTCRYCGTRPRVCHMDHVNPLVHGGSDEVENLVTSCTSCNCRKGGRTPEQAGMRLLPLS